MRRSDPDPRLDVAVQHNNIPIPGSVALLGSAGNRFFVERAPPLRHIQHGFASDRIGHKVGQTLAFGGSLWSSLDVLSSASAAPLFGSDGDFALSEPRPSRADGTGLAQNRDARGSCVRPYAAAYTPQSAAPTPSAARDHVLRKVSEASEGWGWNQTRRRRSRSSTDDRIASRFCMAENIRIF
jgi:hypothetical protein